VLLDQPAKKTTFASTEHVPWALNAPKMSVAVETLGTVEISTPHPRLWETTSWLAVTAKIYHTGRTASRLQWGSAGPLRAGSATAARQAAAFLQSVR